MIQDNLRRYRQSKGWSQSKMAASMGVPRSTYGDWETGRRKAPEWVQNAYKDGAPKEFNYWANTKMSFNERKKLVQSNEENLREQVKKDVFSDREVIKRLREHIYSRVLIIPDLHAPYQHPQFLEFLKQAKDTYHPDLVVCTGDELDNHAMSFHDSDPDLDAAGAELRKGRKVLHELHSIFSVMYLCDSNHGSLAYRRAKKYGFAKHYLLPYRDIIFANRDDSGNIVRSDLGKNWYWSEHIIFNTPKGLVKVKHGESTGNSSADIAKERMNVVRGHWHEQFNIEYSASSKDLIYCMTCGCGIDDESLAFEYNKTNNSRPILGVGLILGGNPMLLPMPLDNNGNFIKG